MKPFLLSVILLSLVVQSIMAKNSFYQNQTLGVNVFCNEEYTGKGHGYRGISNRTVSGKSCEKWARSESHSPKEYPEAGLGDGAGNYCRNPTSSLPYIWCFTDGGDSYEECEAMKCPEKRGNNDSVPNGMLQSQKLGV